MCYMPVATKCFNNNNNDSNNKDMMQNGKILHC